MSFKMDELQEIAERKGKEYFMDERLHCLQSTLLAVNDALKEADDVDYVNQSVLKAASPLPGGFGVLEAPCGIATAGALALGLKYGTSDVYDFDTLSVAWNKSREWMLWLEENFGSYDCFDLTQGTDFTDPEQGKAYDEGPKRVICSTILTEGVKKLVDMLTVDNKKVIR